MSANSRRSKIALPTPETCAWRTGCGDGTATCGLLGSLLGRGRRLTEVSAEQCQACCGTFPPTTSRLNSVVASMLYARLCELRQTGPSEDCSPALVEKLLPVAEKALRPEHADVESSFPLRAWHRCCHLGSAEDSLEDSSGHLLPPSVALVPAQQTFVCHHPAHQRTTTSQCKLCHDWSYEPLLSRKLTLPEIVPPTKRYGQVRYWAVAVTTSPRVQATLGACLESLLRAGWNNMHLFLDGTVSVPPEFAYLPTTWREQPIGACTAWLLSLAELVAVHPEADAYAMFQDDVYLHYGDSLREYLENALWPSPRDELVSLYNPGLNEVRGWHRLPTDWDWGTLAVIFPAQLARAFLSDSIVLRRALPKVDGQHLPIPDLLREWLQRRSLDVWCPSPSLTQHIGLTSTIWPQVGLSRHRQAPWFSSDFEQPRLPHESLSDFDESAFQCAPRDEQTYRVAVDLGREHMRQFSVVICGLCRNVRLFLPRTAARIQRLGSLFGDYRVVLFENDSIDGTREFLLDWQQKNPRVEVISERLGAPQFPQTRDLRRATALAEFRNRYLDRAGERYASFSHVIVVDTDLVGGWSFEGIANSFGYDHWDFVGSYGLHQVSTPPQQLPRRWHYDRWAFRASPTSAATALIDHYQDSLRRGMPLMAVESCFGGLGIYRLECLRDCRYGGEDCEHVVLHDRMRRAGFTQLFLNPSQIVLRTMLIH